MKNLDWANLSFGYMPTDYNVRCYYRDGKWGEVEVCSDEYLKLHMAATCLHYGQEAFEGVKSLPLSRWKGAFVPCRGERCPFATDESGYCNA